MDKVSITRGAIFDYEQIVCFLPFPYSRLRCEAETLITKRVAKGNDLRLKYHDPDAKKDLLLFVRKGYAFGIMQMWILEGICEECDYDPEMEEDGRIRKWLEVEIE